MYTSSDEVPNMVYINKYIHTYIALRCCVLKETTGLVRATCEERAGSSKHPYYLSFYRWHQRCLNPTLLHPLYSYQTLPAVSLQTKWLSS